MRNKCVRLCIYPKDIQRITGKSERYSRALIQKIRRHYGKPAHHFITVDDFCSYTGLSYDKVKEFITG